MSNLNIIEFINNNYQKELESTDAKGNKITEEIDREIKKFTKAFPLSKLKNMKLAEYVQNGNKNTFINMFEYQTPEVASGFLGDNKNRVLYQSSKTNKYYIKNNAKKYLSNDINKAFKTYINDMYNFINEFNDKNYKPNRFNKYTGNVIPAKLLALYRSKLTIHIFTSYEQAKSLAKHLGIEVNRNIDDVISLNIKISKYVYDNDKSLLKKNPHIVGRLIYKYWDSYVAVKDFLSEDESAEKIIDSKKGNKEIESLISKCTTNQYKRSSKKAKEAYKKSNEKCFFDDGSIQHNSFNRRSDKKKYLEIHHIIPVSYGVKINKDVDVVDNIICLCSNCHNMLHYGIVSSEIINKMYLARKQYIESVTKEKMLINIYKHKKI